MHMTHYFHGFQCLEEMSIPKLFSENINSPINNFQFSENITRMSDIYSCLGCSLDRSYNSIISYDNLNIPLSLASTRFEMSRLFLYDYENYLLFHDSNRLKDFVFGLLNGSSATGSAIGDFDYLRQLLNYVSFFSMNQFVDYWENIIAPNISYEINDELSILRSISDQYFSSDEYNYLLAVIEEFNLLNCNDFFSIHSKKKFKCHEEYRLVLSKVFKILNTDKIKLMSAVKFKSDIELIKSTLFNLTNKYPDLFNTFDIKDIYAVQYINSNREIESKLDNCILLSQHFPLKGDYYSVTIFEDKSVLVQRTVNADFELILSVDEASRLARESYLTYLKYITRKNPSTSKRIIEIFDRLFNTCLSGSRCFELFYGFNSVINNYYKNRDILKNNSFDIWENFDNAADCSWLEHANDVIYKLVNEHNIEKYSKCLFSNKYQHLYSDDIIPIFNEFYRLKIPCNYIKEHVGKKMASFKSPDDLFNALDHTLNLLCKFDIQHIMDIVKIMNVEVVSNENNKLILRIKNFKESQLLGSSSWCISREENTFLSYLQNDDEQYFLYNFNRKSRDNDCLIGITLDKHSSLVVAHLKNDQSIIHDDNVDYLVKKVKTYKKRYISRFRFVRKFKHIIQPSINTLA